MRLGLALLLLVSAITPGYPAADPVPTSDTCGQCHRDIYRMWRSSAHATAMEDPVFLDVYRETEAKEGTAVSRTCLRCHAPMTEVNGDFALRQKITWEGVSCDVCHSLTSVNMSGLGPRLVLDVGVVKRGPIRDAVSMAHKVAYSELHTTALACAGCHEYVNPQGTPIMTTYSEWQASTAAKTGKSCQVCHMGRVRAKLVDPRVKRVTEADVNTHEVPGGHSIYQLHKALAIDIQRVRKGDELLVEVAIANRGAGHAVPTGMPGRRVILDVQVTTSLGGSYEERRVYTKSFKDAAGVIVTRDSGFFTRGVQVDADTRIQPDEHRKESFRFPLPAAAMGFVTVRLNYEHAPAGGSEGRTWLTFFSEDRTMAPEPRPGG